MRETINNLLEQKKYLDLFENRINKLFITSYGSYNRVNKARKRV
jgi:hypothetical protein